MSAPKAVIAEDEPVLRAELGEHSRTLWPELVICAEAADGVEALRAIDGTRRTSCFSTSRCPA